MFVKAFAAKAENVVKFLLFRFNRRDDVSVEGLLEHLLVLVVSLFL